MNKKLVASALILTTVVGLGAVKLNKVYAEESEGPMRRGFQAFIERFNLNEDEVNEFMQEQREEREQYRTQHINDKLADAVAEGKITEAQKEALLEKMAEHHSQADELRQQSREEHREQMESHREEFKAWAESQGIDLEELGFMQGPREGMGRGMHKNGMPFIN